MATRLSTLKAIMAEKGCDIDAARSIRARLEVEAACAHFRKTGRHALETEDAEKSRLPFPTLSRTRDELGRKRYAPLRFHSSTYIRKKPYPRSIHHDSSKQPRRPPLLSRRSRFPSLSP